MAKTKAQIAQRVLTKTNRVPIGETADANLTALVKEHYDEVYQELLQDGLVDWGSADSVPDHAVSLIVLLVTVRAADDLRVPEQRLQRLIAQVKPARKQLAAALAATYEHLTTEASSF